MPLQTITLTPGVTDVKTPTLNAAGIQTSQLIRFKPAGDMVLVEKLGGWQKYYSTTVGSPVRALHAWEGTNNDLYLGVGAETSLQVINNGIARNVTPRTVISDVTPNFSTTSGSNLVTIVDASKSTSIYDTIFISTPVIIGGLILYGTYAVAESVSSTTYRIRAASNATSTVSNAGTLPVFATTSGSPVITVTMAGNPYTVGSIFYVFTPTTVGGLTISGRYLVQSIVDSSHFTIFAPSLASSTATATMNGGLVHIVYYSGTAPSLPSVAYGGGAYGVGAYGIGVTPTPTPGTPITTTNWTLDNWGNTLLACPANGPIYYWTPDNATSIASIVMNAPLINGGIFVSNPAQIAIAWASSIDGVQDPLQINWSDSGDYTNWTVSALTQAGGYRIPTGSRIVGGLQGPQFAVIWTDIEVWAMQYIQPPLVYGFNKLGNGCGLISRHGACVVNSTIYWMGNDQFFLYAGAGVQPIVCSVWDFVFQDLDRNNLDKITVAANSSFGEVAWYFPSASGGTGEVDSYVKYNFILNCWDCGRLQRTAWIDQSVLGQPIGANAGGFIYQHEVAPDADGAPMGEYFETGLAQIAQGENLMFVDWMIPDFKYGYQSGPQSANIDITLLYTDYPNRPVKEKGPYQIDSATDYRNPRIRAREVGMRIAGTGTGSFWRMGGLRYRAAPDGKR